MEDNRVILDFHTVKYSVTDLLMIFTDCRDAIREIHNDLQKLYSFFDIIQKNKMGWSRGEVTGEISKRQDVLVNSLPDKDSFLKAVKLARRKFIYWGDVEPCIYGIIDGLSSSSASNIRLKDDIPRDKDFYDEIIACVCYNMVLDGVNAEASIKDDKLCKYKLDYDYVDALKHFSQKYGVDENLNIDLDGIFSDIYGLIHSYAPDSIYEKLVQSLAKNYDLIEERIVANNDYNTELPILWHYVIKSMTAVDRSSASKISNEDYHHIISELNRAVVLLDSNSELDISFLLPNQSEDYLERLMNYSAVYDLQALRKIVVKADE